MTEENVNQHLKNGISKIAPDCFDKIMEEISNREDIESPVVEKRTRKKIGKYLMSVAACFVIFVGSYGIYEMKDNKIATIVELDVNPSIEFGVDNKDKVVEVTALNDDGAEIIENLSLEKRQVQEAILIVMDELVKDGFITKEKSTVLVSVKNDNEQKTEEIKECLSEEIEKHLSEEDIQITVLKQTMIKDEVSESIAKEHNISTGKAIFIKTVMEENSSLGVEEELANMTVDEIAQKAQQGNVDRKQSPNEQKENAGNVNPENSFNEVTTTQDSMKETTNLKLEGDDNPIPTKAMEEKKEPTPISESTTTKKITNPPEEVKKAEPTEIPKADKKEKITNVPEDSKVLEPTKSPKNDTKENLPETTEKENFLQPTEMPEPTKNPERMEKEREADIPESHQQPMEVPDDSGKKEREQQGDERKPKL